METNVSRLNLEQTQFQMTIRNNTTSPIKVALVPAYFDTFGLAVTEDGGIITGVKSGNYFADRLTAAGYPVDFVADDTVGMDFSGVPDMLSMTPSCSINDFRRFIRTNKVWVQQLMIISQQISMFQGVLQFTKIDPRTKAAVFSSGLDNFMVPTQFKSDRILLDFKGDFLGIDETSLLIATIPGKLSSTAVDPVEANFLFTFLSQNDEAKMNIAEGIDRARKLGF